MHTTGVLWFLSYSHAHELLRDHNLGTRCHRNEQVHLLIKLELSPQVLYQNWDDLKDPITFSRAEILVNETLLNWNTSFLAVHFLNYIHLLHGYFYILIIASMLFKTISSFHCRNRIDSRIDIASDTEQMLLFTARRS